MAPSSLLSVCTPDTFSTPPSLCGAEILSIHAVPVLNFTANVPSAYRFVHPAISAENLAFCNVTVTYKHTGTDDEIIVEAWLPEKDNWNERFYTAGGSGWTAGRADLTYLTATGALAEGYATSSTDSGLGYNPDAYSLDWAHTSPGNIDVHKLQDFASVTLNDQVHRRLHPISQTLSPSL